MLLTVDSGLKTEQTAESGCADSLEVLNTQRTKS